jgi:type II secretion system protein H
MAGAVRPRAGGFTLIEIMVVISIIVVVTGMALFHSDSINPRFETNREASEVARLLRNARAEAIITGKIVRGELDPRNHTASFFYEDAADDPQAFSPEAEPYLKHSWSDQVNLEKTMVGADTLLNKTEPVILRFWPTGLCTPVRLYFQHAQRDYKMTLKINPLTGVTKVMSGFEQPSDSEIHVEMVARQPGTK